MLTRITTITAIIMSLLHTCVRGCEVKVTLTTKIPWLPDRTWPNLPGTDRISHLKEYYRNTPLSKGTLKFLKPQYLSMYLHSDVEGNHGLALSDEVELRKFALFTGVTSSPRPLEIVMDYDLKAHQAAVAHQAAAAHQDAEAKRRRGRQVPPAAAPAPATDAEKVPPSTPAATAPPADAPASNVGRNVELKELAREEFNGQSGKITGYKADDQRYVVKLKSGMFIGVKLKNLRFTGRRRLSTAALTRRRRRRMLEHLCRDPSFDLGGSS